MTPQITFKVQYRVELAPTLQGHYYDVWQILPSGKEKYLGVYSSSTTILQAYPQSEQLTKWIAENGWHESRQIRDGKGVSGTKIHSACDELEAGSTLLRTFYTLEEWNKIDSFIRWHQKYNPTLLAAEVPVFSKKGKFAGKPDRIYTIDGENILLDFKSSSSLHKQFPLQFSSYAKAIEENSDIKIHRTAVLQLGTSNGDHYRYVTYPDTKGNNDWHDHYRVFQSVRDVWEYDNLDSKGKLKQPEVLILPDTLSLKILDETHISTHNQQ